MARGPAQIEGMELLFPLLPIFSDTSHNPQVYCPGRSDRDADIEGISCVSVPGHVRTPTCSQVE